nr:hypothetical protein [Acidobacteriota bacterium]
ADALGTYNRYAYAFANFPDYPKFGTWPDGYYFSFNMFTPAGDTYVGARACTMDRAKALLGQPANFICFQLDANNYSLLPSDLDGHNQPPPGSPNFFVQDDPVVFQLDLFRFHVNFNSPGSSTFGITLPLQIPAYNPACGPTSIDGVCVPQLGQTQQLDTLGNRLMYRLSYRNFGDHESLYASETIGLPTGIRWYELRNPNAATVIYQQGTYSPDTKYRFMPSIAADRKGNIALGYSASDSTIHPGVRFTGRTPADPLNTMDSEKIILNGLGSQTMFSRWGDYTSMSVDPVDDCALYYTDQYLPRDGIFNWRTRIAKLRFPDCNGAPTVIGVVPSSGSGSPRTFHANYGDPDGGADLNLVYILFNTSPSLVNACAAAYDQPNNALYLFNDAGTGLLGPLTRGGAGSVSNSRCTLNAAGSSVLPGPTDLKVNFNFSFKPAFVGTKNIYLSASDLGGLVDAGGFQKVGTFTTAVNLPPTADSVSPNVGAGTPRTFTFTYSDPNSFNDIVVTYSLFNASLSAANGCVVAYVRPSNALYLYNDAGTALVPGAANTLSNKQCILSSPGPVTGSGNSLTVPITLAFLPAFTGLKNIYGVALDSGGLDSGYQKLGTWARSAADLTVSITPNAGSSAGGAATQTFSMVFSDATDANALSLVATVFNSTLSFGNGCVVVYYPSSNSLGLLNDAGSGFQGLIAAGGAGSVSNTQCAMTSGGAASAVGRNLTVPVNLRFNHVFAGTKNIYMIAFHPGGVNDGWQTAGAWTVP